MIEINEAQLESLSRKWGQDTQGMTFQEFKATAQSCVGDKSIMVLWCGMWLGIEVDGYTHS
jgi:hypothetical protein